MASPDQCPDAGSASQGVPRLTKALSEVPAVVEEQIATRFTDPLQKRGWLWRGRPLDLFALIVVVLGVQTGFDLFVSSGRSAVWVLARSSPILFIGIVVAVIAVVRPEALAGRRPAKRTKAK